MLLKNPFASLLSPPFAVIPGTLQVKHKLLLLSGKKALPTLI